MDMEASRIFNIFKMADIFIGACPPFFAGLLHILISYQAISEAETSAIRNDMVDLLSYKLESPIERENFFFLVFIELRCRPRHLHYKLVNKKEQNTIPRE